MIALDTLGNIYLQTESRTPFATSGLARLISRHVPQQVPSTTKVTFYFRLPLGQTKFLKLNVKFFEEEIEIWRSRQPINTWQSVTLTLCFNPGYQLVFETNAAEAEIDAVVLFGELSAIDDQQLLSLTCPSPILTCDFEDGFCGWRAQMDQKLRFRRTNGSIGFMGIVKLQSLSQHSS